MDATILQNMSDPEFRVIAFEEYCARAADRYANLVSAVSAIPNYIPDDPETPTPSTDEILRAVMTDYSLVEVPISFQSGYCSLSSMLRATIEKVLHVTAAMSEEESNESLNDTLDIPAVNCLGEPSDTGLGLSVNTIADELKSNLHSVVSLQAAASAFNIRAKTGGDFISTFNDKIGQTFSNVHADISSTAGYLKNQLSVITDPSAFLNTIIKAIGVEHESTATAGDTYAPSQADISQYTGASPSCALDFSSATNVIASTIKVAAKGIAAIAKGLFMAGKALFSRVTEKVTSVTSDPDDLERISTKGFNTVDGFYVPLKDDNLDHWLFTCPFWLPQGRLQEAAQLLNGKSGNWFAFKTLFGEYMFRWVSGAWSQYTEGAKSWLKLNLSLVEGLMKPRVVNTNIISAALPSRLRDETVNFASIAEINDFLVSLQSYGSQLYDLEGVSEANRYRGLIQALSLSIDFAGCASDEIKEAHPSYVAYNPDQIITPSSVTNADWLNAFSSWSGGDFRGPSGINNLHSNFASRFLFQGFVEAACWSLIFENLFPTDQAPFVPYSNNHTNFADPSFRIVTDAENRSAFNKFVTTAVVVTVTAIVAVTALVVIKKIARSMFWKRTELVGRADNAMWNGQTLSKRDKRKYLRAKKKLDVSNSITSGLTSDTFLGSSTSNTDGLSISSIIGLIRG